MSNQPKCIACDENCSFKDTIGKEKWDALRTKSEKWDGLDKYGELCKSTDWDAGPANKYIHISCYTSISSARTHKQAVNRKEKQKEAQKQCSSASNEGKHVSKTTLKMKSHIWVGIHLQLSYYHNI